MIKKIFRFILVFLIAWFIGRVGSSYVRQLLVQTGIVKEEVFIAGTGSMYPTFPKGKGDTDMVRAAEIVAFPKMRRYPAGISFLGTTLFPYTIRYGDIVEFENEKTYEITEKKYEAKAGFVKRVIGVAGDTLELRDGYVILNNKILNEPYTAKPRSSYGGEFLPDCRKFTVPAGKLFVLGDNRKASLDSRFELGLVDLSHIHYVIPWNEQEEYRKTWRNTGGDSSLSHSPTLSGAEFLTLLNEKRKEKNLKPLTYNTVLGLSTKIRGKAIITSNDFSIEATRSGISLSQSLREARYHNIISGELFTRGFYEAEELVENLLEFPEGQKMLFSKEYQEIGVSPALGDIESCPTQVVVVHLGGYVPPHYSKGDIESWAQLVENIESVYGSWESLKEADGIDKDKLNRLLFILSTRKSNAQKILSRMRGNQWLTDEERRWGDDDKRLSSETEKIISELSKR